MRTFRCLTFLITTLLLLGTAAVIACVVISGFLRNPVALLLDSDQRLTYLDLSRRASLTTANAVTLGTQHTIRFSPNGRYLFNLNSPYSLYDSVQGKLSTLPVPEQCVKFQLSDHNVGCIDHQRLYVVDLKTHQASYPFPPYAVHDFVWVADGQGVVFTQWQETETEFFTALTPDSNPRRIASAAGRVTLNSISPDQRLVTGLMQAGDHWSMLFVDLYDGSTRTLDYDPTAINHPVDEIIWSPDSRKAVIFTSIGKVEYQAIPERMDIVDAAGGTVTSISADSASASWSPDGARLLYIEFHRFTGGLLRDLFVIQADGSKQARVAHNPSGSYFWSLSSDLMLTVRDNRLYELPMKGGLPIPKANWPISATTPPILKFFWR